MKLNRALLILALAGFAGLFSTPARAGLEKSFVEPEVAKETSIFETLWALPVLYENKQNPFIQKVAFIGRYHGNLWALDSNFGNNDDWDNRRARFGLEVAFLEKFRLDFNVNLDLDGNGRFVQDLEEIRLRYRPNSNTDIWLGRLKTRLTNEWWESSNRLDFAERSLLVNQTIHGKLWGGLIDGTVNNFVYSAGVFTATRETDLNFPTFDGGAVLYGGLGIKPTEKSVIRLDYAYQTDQSSNNSTRPYDHLATLSYDGIFDRLRLRSDLIYADGSGTVPDAYGFIIHPTYEIVEKTLYGVVRYQYATGDGDSPIQLQSRYEREAPDLTTTRGDNYHAIYGGLNYHIYGHNLKLQGGLEYATADLANGQNFESWTAIAAVRFSF